MQEARRDSGDPLDQIEWVRRDATVVDADGTTAFAMTAIEAPKSWSDGAVGVVASRYLRGGPAGASVRELLRRVGGTLGRWLREQGLGDGETERALLDLLVRQRGAFNSPVWFNVGVDDPPQCSACFILSVEDSLDSILELARTEGLIFQRGSGAGTNLSSLRSSREPLHAGGTASGPVSFMRGYDAFAGVVKSGGRTRRAAKMQILDASHPDVVAFADAKAAEEKKAQALVAAGYDAGIDGEAYRSVAFQNSNLSVRCPDPFFDAVEKEGAWGLVAVTTGDVVETLPARALLRKIAEGAWACGDPGVQYATTIESWNPCPNSGPIRASNPCSEYLFLDDTACNLASLNLLAYLGADGAFDVAGFRRDAGTLFRAMEAIVDESSYPTPRIAERSRRFRPLGLGYANLGALVMALGLPYDSDAARGWAGALTALLTGEAYRVSAEMAGVRGACDGYGDNAEAVQGVLERHAAAVDRVVDAPRDVLAAARNAWSDALRLARVSGVRNCQATVLAPTGTIAFLMDCDTTGIEPDLQLVKYKRLVGGGTLRMANRCVGRGLVALGYAEDAAARIVRYVEEFETIEGAPGLADEHLPVFDCAFPTRPDGRVIRPAGHLLMMAAVQPFLSGGISKTVNLPRTATVADIEEMFLEGWRLGLKSLAVYREGSKGAQPLATRCILDEPGSTCCD